MSIDISEEYYDREPHTFSKITLGVVEKVDDTLQQLRLYIRCPSLGDFPEKLTDDLPVSFLMSPLLGESVYRDDGSGLPEGSTCYGLVLPPRVGAQAIVACIDDNTDLRICLGFINTDFILDTFPGGRYTTSNNTAVGPLTSDEYALSKQSRYYAQAFGDYDESNFEKISRCYDRPISKIPDYLEEEIKNITTNDTPLKMNNGSDIQLNQGYTDDPNLPDVDQKAGTVYGLTTPMGHMIYCDDAPANSRVKVRTANGSQILLDDTNERIYINTAEGNSWIEMDYDGNVDMFCYNYNVHATNDVNITADNNINIKSTNFNNVVINNAKFKQNNLSIDTTTKTILYSNIINETFNTHVYKSDNTEALCTNFKQKSTNISFDSDKFESLSQTLLLTGSDTNILGSSQILLTGGSIHFNGPGAQAANSVTTTTPEMPTFTKWTTRRPDHEPWPRMSFADDDVNHTVYKFSSTDPNIGKENISNLMYRRRNAFWRR